MTPKLSLKNKEHQKSDFLTGFNFWRFKSNPCVITFLSNSKTAYYWVPWDSNDVEAFPSVVLISYARSQRKNHLIKIFTKILILMPKLLEHWPPVDISNQKCSVISIGFVFRSTLILLKYLLLKTRDQGHRNVFYLGEDRSFRIWPSIFLKPSYLPMQFNVMCVMGLKNDKLQKQ